MICPKVVYRPCDDATPEKESGALANVYRLIIDSAKKEGSRPGAPDTAKGSKHDSRHPKYTR